MWRLSVDRTACRGTGVCVGTARAYFGMAADGRSYPITGLVEPDEAALDAAHSCPMEAISVRDTGTGAVLAPRDGPPGVRI